MGIESDIARATSKADEKLAAPPADGGDLLGGSMAATTPAAARLDDYGSPSIPLQPDGDTGLLKSASEPAKGPRSVRIDDAPPFLYPTGARSDNYFINDGVHSYLPPRMHAASQNRFSSYSDWRSNEIDPEDSFKNNHDTFSGTRFGPGEGYTEGFTSGTEEQSGPHFDSSQFIYGFNIHMLANELGRVGVAAFLRNYEVKLGLAKARQIFYQARDVFVKERGHNPLNNTVIGEQILARLNFDHSREKLAIGGSSIVGNADYLDNPQLNHDINMDQEMTLTYARDRSGRPLFNQGMQFANAEAYVDGEILGGDSEVYTNGGEKMVALLGAQLHKIFRDTAQMSIEDRVEYCARAFDPVSMDRLIEQGRRTELKLEEKPSFMTEIPAPLLKGPGDRTGDVNEKAIKELKSRLGDKSFSGQPGDESISCRLYLENMRRFLEGRFNEIGAYDLFRATTKGKVLNHVENTVALKPPFRHFWSSMCNMFARAENPEEALMRLQSLRYDRPVDLTSRFCKIQQLANTASHAVAPQLRLKRCMDLMRDEAYHMLGTWFPEQLSQITSVDKRKAQLWMSERKGIRRQGRDPDREISRCDYHPWITLQEIILSSLQHIYPVDKPRGYVPKRQASAPVERVKKKKKANGLFEIVAEDRYDPIPEGMDFNDEQVNESKIIEEYAESIASDRWYDDEEANSEYGVLSEVEEVSDDEEREDIEVAALHKTPAELMRRFAERPRPPRQERDRDGKGGRDFRGGDRQRGKDTGEAKRFPHKGEGDKHRICACCGSRTHSWDYCGAYDGAEPVADKRGCCNWYHPGTCKIKEAKELEQKKKQRAMERGAKQGKVSK